MRKGADGSVEFGDAAGSADLAVGGVCYRRRDARRSRPAGAMAAVDGADSRAHLVRGLVSSVRRRSCVLAVAAPAVDGATAGLQERAAYLAFVALNLGLVLRIIAEPAERAGLANDVTLALLGASAFLQVAATLVFVIQLWPRVGPRPMRGKGEQRV
jgi:hypothetical protein